jgi:hypothetical protein
MKAKDALRYLSFDGEFKEKARAQGLFALGTDMASVKFDDPGGRGQSQTC